jgi:UDP-N-acetylglucosamine--N-acetylmuramyl-(pentapeptide) pyrophosphoryl-undecaprenol N-acetylglucosamine transferase
MEMLYAAANVVVSRAGTITCSELLVTAKPSILVPATTVAEDHQMKNAMAMAEAGAAKVLAESELNSQTLASAIDEILGDKAGQKVMQEKAQKMAAPDAAVQIATQVLSLAA